MLKIRPLNRESLSDEDAPVLRKELQEEIALEMYNKALRLEAKGEYDEARDLLLNLINENIPQLDSQGGLPKSMSTLKYSSYLNIGNTYLAQKQIVNALENYLIASELDETDVTLWYKIGKLALKENRFRQSIFAFSKGLNCNESHWPCLDEIISLLFAVRDTISCLYYIGKALILDPEYTKGLVFRKQIYKDNPAAKEYYQKSNPDYIWEPSLDIEVDEKDEIKHLNEVQHIIDRITEVEKALESKPLSTIPLPKALENYSWLAISKSVISLYQYIQSNELSLFTFVDINKCMSQIHDSEVTNMEIEEPKTAEVLTETNKVEDPDSSKKPENTESDLVVERRLSQNSDENATPIQTDNDEEQQTEQEVEEQEERNDKSRPKGYKRKRDLLLDLRVWGWHSKRKHVRKSKPEKFYTVEDCLNQTLPPHLLRSKIGDAFSQDDSMNTMDMYNMFLEDRNLNILSPIHSPKSSNLEPYFGTDKEKEDVIKSWSRPRKYCDICVLVEEFVLDISQLWNMKWSTELIEQYIIAYEIDRKINELPSLYNPENVFEDIRKETLATLLYAELVMFSCPKNMKNERMLHIGHIQFLESMTTYWELNWGDEYIFVFLRVLWLRAYIYRKERNNESAVRFLQLIQELLCDEEKKTGEKFCLVLPNSRKCGLISMEVTKRMLKQLDMIESISCLEDLYNQEKYKEVAEIIISTFTSNFGYPTFGKVGRPAQLGMLLHALWFTDFDQCFIWSEECLFEAHAHYNRPGQDRTRWEKVVEKCLGMLHEIIKQKSRDTFDLLSDDKKARLTETLAKIICKQINTENAVLIPLNTVIPWILLHHILAKNEEKERKSKENNTEQNEELVEEAIPLSLSILFSAHEFLGPKSWCLTNQGELLHFILDVLLDKEDVYKYERLREKLDIQIEQALFCLYQHPSKKNKISRHLADHNVDPLPLTWEKSFQLYEFYAPEVLPEFNSFKNASISMDLEQLLLRITALVVPECDPTVSISKINEYLQGETEKIPDPIKFPNKIRAIYYLLGDYYFKLRDFVRCVKYFLMDLAINPQRVDSWACLGLSFFSQLEIKLNFCKRIKNEEDFLEKAKCAQVGFKTALKLSPNDMTLWIEYGTFEYMAHSFCSRYLKFESENMSIERFEYLENQKNAYLDSSGQSFEKAIALYETNENETDERWLQYYILGKIAEKKQSEPNEYLKYYLTASQLLHENHATYPVKIAYNSPSHLSVEALELHYRINASILKYLELHEGKDIHYSKGALFKKTLDALAINRNLAAQKAQKKLEKSKGIEQQKEENENKAETIVGHNQIATKTEESKTETSAKSDAADEKIPGSESGYELAEGVQDMKCAKEKENIIEVINTLEDQPVEASNEVDIEMEKEVKESVNNLLQKVEDIDKASVDNDPPLVEVVDEVILLDGECDIIMILSSDEDESEGEMQPSKDDLPQSVNDEMEVTYTETTVAESSAPNTSDSRNENLKISESVPCDSGIGVHENSPNKEKPEQDSNIIDVQLVLDKMMEETMQIASEEHMELDSDTSIIDKSIEIIDCSAINNEDLNSNKKDDQKVADSIEESENVAESALKDKEISVEIIEENKDLNDESSSSSSSSESSDSSSSSDSDSDDDSSSSSSNSSTDDSTNEILSNNEILHLVDRCVKGLEQCMLRLTKNYKAIYRLVHLFFNYKSRKDLNRCKQLLLGEYKCYENTGISGLFADRKATNFFNGIWRIPSSEIDRPGSLAAHMSRCVTILLQILRATNDCKILLDLYFQLRKSPDQDKVYIKDSERIQFSEQALSLCIQSFRQSMKNMDSLNSAGMRKLLHDIHKAYVRIQKHVPEKEQPFSQMLIEVYKTFIKEKIPDNVNILELATKFCQQTKNVDKHKNMAAQNMSIHNPLLPMGPVLPSPSTINAGNMASLKRPSYSGRPRGRPPLPKVPSQPKSSRGKSPITSTPNWKKTSSDQTLPYDYIKHYQEELMKQYKQNLNFMQMAQLTQMYSNTYANAFMQAQQTSMLSANFLSQLSNLGMAGTMTDNTSMSQLDALQSKFNEMMSMVKRGPALSNFSVDELMASSSKSNLPSKKSEIVSSKKQKSTNQNQSNKASIGICHQDTKPAQDKSKLSDIERHSSLSTNTGPIELSKKRNTMSPSKISQSIDATSTSQNNTLISKESTPVSSSNISVIPLEKLLPSTCDENRIQLSKIGATVSKVPSITTASKMMNKPESKQQQITTSMEATIKKFNSFGNNVIPLPHTSTSPCSSFSTVIMPPPTPLMPPPSSPLSISSLSPSGGSPNTKLPSPRKSPSPVNMNVKDTIPKLNIEAMISRVSVAHPESHEKHIIDMESVLNRVSPTCLETQKRYPKDIEALITRVSPTQCEPHKQHIKEKCTTRVNQTSSSPDTGLPKFPSSLSMTPVNIPVKTIVEPQHSISLHKVPAKPDPLFSKLPSSITLTASSPKPSTSTKNSDLNHFGKSQTGQSISKSGGQLSSAIAKTYSGSSNPIYTTNQSYPKLPSGIEMKPKVIHTTYQRSSKIHSAPETRKPESAPKLTPFNIESMLQTTVKSHIPSSSKLTYGYSRPASQTTSVITSTNASSSAGQKVSMDSTTSLFKHLNQMAVDGRNTSKTGHIEIGKIAAGQSSIPSKSKTGHRTSSSELYKDTQHTINLYPSSRQDKSADVSKATKVISTVSSVPKTSSSTNFLPTHVQTSPGKTLQEKLADKKREQANKQLIQHIEKQPAKNVGSSFNNPHSISNMLHSSNEVEITKIPSVKKSASLKTTARPAVIRRKSSSEDSVICID